MSRYSPVCEVCGQLGPYGFFRPTADGSPGRVWACPDHRETVKRLPGVELPAPVPAKPPAAGDVPAARRVGQGALL